MDLSKYVTSPKLQALKQERVFAIIAKAEVCLTGCAALRDT